MKNNYIDIETVSKIKQLLKKKNLNFITYANGRVYAERKHVNEIAKYISSYENGHQILNTLTPVYGALQILDLFNDSIEKIMVVCKSDRAQLELLDVLIKLSHISIQKKGKIIIIISASLNERA